MMSHTRGNFVPPPGDTRRWLETFLVITTGEEVLLASGGWKPGTLLNTLQCTMWPPLQRLTQPRVNSASVGTETDQGRAVI